MAPEQITRSEATARSDLFSLAVVAYEALTGQRPFLGDSVTAIIYQVVNGAHPAPSTLAPDLPPTFDDVFQRALAKRPEQRFGSALALLRALKGEAFEAVPAEELPDLDLASMLGLDGTPEGAAARPAPGAVETLEIGAVSAAVTRRRRSLWIALGLMAVLLAASLLAVVRIPPSVPALTVATAGRAVESDPSGAEVWLDDARAGLAPVVLSQLQPGPHRLRVVREGFAPAEVMLQVADGMGLVPLRFALSGVTSPVDVQTDPGVTVRIDGQEIGRTPLPPVHVSPGVHELRLERRGFLPQRHALLARAGEPLTIAARLQPAPAQVADAEPPPPTLAALPAPVVVAATAAPVTPPRPLRNAAARYPEEARRLQLAGSVLVEATVEHDGRVSDVRVLESAGSVLDDAVVTTVRRWEFDPGRQEGRPVRSFWRYRQTFRPR
jgi:TonB family protein